jgi:hypothetical protein
MTMTIRVVSILHSKTSFNQTYIRARRPQACTPVRVAVQAQTRCAAA